MNEASLESPFIFPQTSDRTVIDAAFSVQVFEEDDRSVRVFVSSTFLDMQAERDELVTKVFPALRAKYRARGVEVFEVDLRWGITREQQEKGETLPTLLAEIDRCRPYFVGLLGGRYGWVPPTGALTEKLKADHPELADAEGMSVTAMEMVCGLLGNSETAARVCFFERDPAWDWISTLDVVDRSAAMAERGETSAKLDELKERIRRTGASIVSYARPDEIHEKAINALDALLEERFPATRAPDAFEQTARLHRAYARERRGLHVGAAEYLGELDTWIETANAPPKLITGASGGGKSTLVANWLHEWCKSHPESRAYAFEHYLGASPDSADPVLIMRRLWEHMNRATGETVDLPGADAGLMDLSARLAQRLSQARATAAKGKSRLLIVLDGLDKLANETNLRWLPLTPGVHVLASGLDCDVKADALARGFVPLHIHPLAEEHRQEFVAGTLARWRRRLAPRQVDALLTPKALQLAGSPLYLKTVLNELRVSADHARLDLRLDDYRDARDLPDLFDRVLARLEQDCEAGLAAKALSLIWASRAGLEEADIIAIARTTPLAWAILRNGLSEGLRDQQGRMAFSHDYLRMAAEARYLRDEDARRAAHLAVANHFETRGADTRQAEELPFQLRAAQAWDRLETLLVDLDRFDLLRERGDSELLSNWLPLKERSRDPETLLCAAFDKRTDDHWSKAEIDLARSLQFFLHFAGAHGERQLSLARQCCLACERTLGSAHQETLASRHALAVQLKARGELAAAEELEFQVLEALSLEHPAAITAANTLSQIARARGDLPKARELADRVLTASRHVFGANSLWTIGSITNLAGILRAQGAVSAAVELQQEGLNSAREQLGESDPTTLSLMNNLALSLRALGELPKAESFHRRVLALEMQTLGPEHPHTLSSANNLAQILKARGDVLGARNIERQNLETAARALGQDHPQTLTFMANLAATLRDLDELDQSKALFERALDGMKRATGENGPLTLTTMGNFALALRRLGRPRDAEAIQQQVLQELLVTLGPAHSDTITAMGNLAATLYVRGDIPAAGTMVKRIMQIEEGLFGSDHPSTRSRARELAEVLNAPSELCSRQLAQERELDRCMDAFGGNHPRSLSIMNEFAETLYQRGDMPRARLLLQTALDGWMQSVGPDHPNTGRAQRNLAIVVNEIVTQQKQRLPPSGL